MVITSEEYAELVEDALCEKLMLAVYDVASQANQELGNMTGVDLTFGNFESSGYADGYLPEMRDLAIKWMEAMGFDVQPDGSDY